MRNKISIFAILVFTILVPNKADTAEKATPYVDGSKSFLAIKNVNRQSEAWAMCAATYDVMAEIISETHPARAQQLREFSNGAEVAILMSIVLEGLAPEISQEHFNALWSMAQLAKTELPKTMRTMLAAEAESSSGKEKEAFLEKLAATIEICVKNLEGQQMYIDSWRELAKTGLLKLPNKSE